MQYNGQRFFLSLLRLLTLNQEKGVRKRERNKERERERRRRLGVQRKN